MHNRVDGFRLSPQQRQVWLLKQKGSVPRTQCAVRITGTLKTELLREAVQKVVDRHEILRTTFYLSPGDNFPIQVIADDVTPYWRTVGFSDPDHREQEAVIDRLMLEEGKALTLEQNPIFRLCLVTLSANDHCLIISLPSISADHRTLTNLVCEINDLYTASYLGKELPGAAIQYIQFSEWQNELLEEEEATMGETFWSTQELSNPPALPFEGGRVSDVMPDPLTFTTTIAHDVVENLERMAWQGEYSKNFLLLSCWQTLLWRLTGQFDITLTTLFDGRRFEDLHEALGLFAKYLPIQSHFKGAFQLADILKQTRRSVSNAGEWQDYYLGEKIEGASRVATDCQVGYDFETWPSKRGTDILFSICKQYVFFDRFKLRLSCVSHNNSIITTYYFDPNLYSLDDIKRLSGQFHKLLESFVKNPEESIANLELLSEAERRQLIIELNSTKKPYPEDECVHQLFEAQSFRTPDSIALTFADQSLTYAELNSQSNQMARYLMKCGVRPESPVAVCCERSPEMLIGLLAILKAGGAYIPLDPSYPLERLAFILDDTRACVVITQGRLVDALPASLAQVVCIDRDRNVIAKESRNDVVCEVKPDNLAYVIYTSGSTGKPKGVMISHRGLVNYLNWCVTTYALEDGDGAPVHSPLSFDLTVTSIFAPLLTGKSVFLLQEYGGVENLAEALSKRGGFSLVKLTPAHLEALNRLSDTRPPAGQTRTLVIGGEALMNETISSWRAHMPQTKIVNEYGPTEAVVGCCAYEVQDGESFAGSVPIGRPIANAQIFLLDSQLKPAPVGVIGELHIGGVGLARGYLNLPDLTAEKFIPNPFNSEPSARIYKAGDNARFLPNGNLEFLGRNDHQVKVHGYRIELGEIEASLAQHPAIRECAVLVREDAPGDKRLVAYLVPDRDRAFVIQQLMRLEKDGLLEEQPRCELPNGMTIVYLNKDETDQLYQEIFEQQAYLRHGITLGDGDCIFDVGANVGMFSLFASQISKGSLIYAFEPIKPVYDLLCTNASLYGLNTKLFNCGLGSEVKSDTFTYYPNCSVISGRFANAAEEQEVVKAYLLNQEASADKALLSELLEERLVSQRHICQLRTISDVIREDNIKQIDLLKIDAEKSELDVLGGIHEEDWPKIRQIVVEVHSANGRLNQVKSLLEEHGYSLMIEQDAVYSNTGLYNIYASQPSRMSSTGSRSYNDTIQIFNSRAQLVTDVRRFLGERLPGYMIPSAYVLLESMPLTHNGKVARQDLPAPNTVEVGPENNYVAPRTPIEEMVATVWAEILRLSEVSADANFFESGGHSLLATQLIAMLRRNFQAEIPLRALFEAPTIAQLAESIEKIIRAGLGQRMPVIDCVSRDRELPLSFGQQRLWFLDKMEPGNSAYNILAAVRLLGNLDITALSKAINELLRRHEILRTTFREVNGQPRQIIAAPAQLSLLVSDLSHLSESEKDALIEATIAEAAKEPFDLEKGPLFRISLLMRGEDDHVAVMTMHHIASDGRSMDVLVRELAALYKAYCTGEESPLAELPIQYADYAVWQRGWLKGEELERHLAYWRKQLGGELVMQEFPTDRPRPVMHSYRGESRPFAFTGNLSRELEALSRREGVTLFMALLAAFDTLLFHYIRLEDILVGTNISNRNRTETEGLIGFFINTLPLRINLAGNPSFRHLLQRVREVALEAYAYQEMPFDKLVENLQPERDLSRMPLIPIVFNFQNEPVTTLELPELKLTFLPAKAETTRSDLILDIVSAKKGLRGSVVYSTDLYNTSTIERIIFDFELILQNIVIHPDISLLELSGILTETEKQRWVNREKQINEVSLRKLGNARRKAGDRSRSIKVID